MCERKTGQVKKNNRNKNEIVNEEEERQLRWSEKRWKEQVRENESEKIEEEKREREKHTDCERGREIITKKSIYS